MRSVLLTGATGFLGKVVLETLLRRGDEIGLDLVYVLVRPTRRFRADERFHRELRGSRCFSKLPSGWEQRVRVVSGDLRLPGCGIPAPLFEELRAEVSRVIHCAASVEFDLPLAEAAESNVTSALHVLELARGLERLEALVHVSTAYVHSAAKAATPVHERLAPLTAPAASIYGNILAGEADEKRLLAENGFPNTYTFTKCLAEHILLERAGEVPISIVRPSIISASWKHPFPGWIDSLDAYAGFVAMTALGHLKALRTRAGTRADIVPVDEVAARIFRCAYEPFQSNTRPRIVHAVAGLPRSCSTSEHFRTVSAHFRKRPIEREPEAAYAGPDSLLYRLQSLRHHRVPLRLAELGFRLRREPRMAKKAAQLLDKLEYLNSGFRHFTHHAFDFRSSMPFDDPEFCPRRYIETVCRGVEEHALKRPVREHRLLGGDGRPAPRGLSWIARRTETPAAVRAMGGLIRATAGKCFSEVTFDRESFDRLPRDGDRPIVLVPTHRSYGDFLLWSYLFFTHPELGIRMPRIAATAEFGAIPVVGKVLEQCGAFYIRRGLGREDPELTRAIEQLVERGETLQFFIEGRRSRSGRFLPPRRGMLRALQATGREFTILPLSIAYDRVGEESALLGELRDGARRPMGLRRIAGWMRAAHRGELKLGRAHLACGRALELGPKTQIGRLTVEIMGELQANTAVFTGYLQSFLERHPQASFDLRWLRESIEARGGRVLESGTAHARVTADAERHMRFQWEHWFYQDALEVYEGHPAVSHHIGLNGFHKGRSTRDPRAAELVRLLFEPVCQDYIRVAGLGNVTLREVLGADPGLSPAIAEQALEAIKGGMNVQKTQIPRHRGDRISRQTPAPGSLQ